MKKILTILIAILLILPSFVFADAIHTYSYYNHNAVVGGELEVIIPMYVNMEYNLELKFDKEYLSTAKDMVAMNKDGAEDLLEVNVEEGKLTIKAKKTIPSNVVNDNPNPYLTIRFKALKEGNVKIEINGRNPGDFIEDVEATITKLPVEKEESPEPTEPVETIGSIEKTDNESNSNLPLYISLGCNALLLIAFIIVVIFKGRKTGMSA